ncbi:MAG: hypothetical protein N0C90_26300, partial [Candidatus Thiodiazotropha endolucinida]|nr:hypothetical protein [Candidatus Thiodiazotropha taylori]MCW4264860.1 hypothetical protein [Candidatus Thiodiazotropha endolucinida]
SIYIISLTVSVVKASRKSNMSANERKYYFYCATGRYKDPNLPFPYGSVKKTKFAFICGHNSHSRLFAAYLYISLSSSHRLSG